MIEKKLMVIAAPKTASTSLLHDLVTITGIKGKQLFQPLKKKKINFLNKRILQSQRYLIKLFGGNRLTSAPQSILRDLYPSTGYPFLRVLHSDVCDLRGVNGDMFKSLFPFKIHKQHLPPTEANIELVQKYCSIILLINDPAKIIESYSRVPGIKRKYKFTKRFESGLYEDLTNFIKHWKKVVPKSQTIYKENLIDNPHIAINTCLRLMELNHKLVSEDYSLSKQRYYRKD